MVERKAALRAGRSALKRERIRTTADLDRWIRAHPCPDGSWMSRFKALSGLAGQAAAVWMLNDLAIEECA